MMTKHAVAPLAAMALFLAACADPISPSRSLVGSNIPSLDFATNPAVPADNNLIVDNLGMTGGLVQVCKTTPAGDPALMWSFTVAVTNEAGTTPVAGVTSPLNIQGVSGGTACATAYHSTVSGTVLQRVTITEAALPANWTLTHLHVDMYRDGADYMPLTRAGANAILTTGSLATRSATSYINQDMQRIFTFTNDFTAQPVGDEGCTPGYWKQDHHFDSWPAAYTQNTLINTALSTTIFPATMTLLQALNANGGGINALARHAAAALLNAASTGVDYPMTVLQVQNTVDGAGSIEARKDIFANNNELGCPLN